MPRKRTYGIQGKMKKRVGALYNDRIVDDLIVLQSDVHGLAHEKGWWSDDQDHIAIKCERVHAEISELCDTFARGTNDTPDKDCPSHTKAEIEWADCMLRLLDIAGRYGFRPSAITAKHEFNYTRPLRHGGKRF